MKLYGQLKTIPKNLNFDYDKKGGRIPKFWVGFFAPDMNNFTGHISSLIF